MVSVALPPVKLICEVPALKVRLVCVLKNIVVEMVTVELPKLIALTFELLEFILPQVIE